MRRLIFWLIIIIFVASVSIYRNVTAGKDSVGSRQVISLIEGAKSAKHYFNPIDHYRAYGPDKKLIGYAVRTAKISPQVTGYGGEIDCLVGIDLEGKITAIEVVAHQESPDYMPIVLKSDLFRRMIGLTGGEVRGLDAVTSATMSSSAIIKDVAAAVENAAASLMGVNTSGLLDYEVGRAGWESFLILLPLFVGGVAIFKPQKRYLRAISLVSSVVIIGVLLNTPVTIGNILDMAGGSFFMAGGLALSILMAAAILMGLFKGPFYCQYICPFGALQEGASALSRREARVGEKMTQYASYLRYLLVIIVVVSVVILGLPEFRMIEPFSRCFSVSLSQVALIQAGVVIFFSFFIRRVWCRFFCPTGLFMEAVSELGMRIKRFVVRRS